VLFFKAPWCAACHALEPHVPEYCEHVDCNEDLKTAHKYGITTLPLFIAIDENEMEISRIQTTSIPALENWKNKLEAENG
jgi:thiol-disulfide isomerase/thioredoxin